MKILCINVRKGLGDQIIFLPYIHAISKKFKCQVSLLAKSNSRAKDLFEDDNHINEIITLEKDMDGTKGIFKLTSEIKKRHFDKVFIFNSSLRYHIVSKLAGIKSINQYPLFLKKDNIVHSAKIFTQSITNNIVNTEPNLLIKKKEINLDKNFKYICLGISASGPTKRWGIENYIKLAEELVKNKKCKFYLAGGKNDMNLINEFKKSKVGKDAISFGSMKIRDTLKYISNSHLYVGNDTGWAHLSVALNVKALTIFCDSPVAAYGSYSKKMFTIEPEGIAKGTTTHNTLGKEKISFNYVLERSLQLLS